MLKNNLGANKNRCGPTTTIGCLCQSKKHNVLTSQSDYYSQPTLIGWNEIVLEESKEPSGNSNDLTTLVWTERKKRWNQYLGTRRWYETLPTPMIMLCTSQLWREPEEENTQAKTIKYFDPHLGWDKPDPPPGEPM